MQDLWRCAEGGRCSGVSVVVQYTRTRINYDYCAEWFSSNKSNNSNTSIPIQQCSYLYWLALTRVLTRVYQVMHLLERLDHAYSIGLVLSGHLRCNTS